MSQDPRLESEPNLAERLLKGLENLRIQARPFPSRYWNAEAGLVELYGPNRPPAPTFSKRNDYGDPVALRQLDVIFDTRSATQSCHITVGGADIFSTRLEPTGRTPYHGTDITLDFREGIIVEPGRAVDVYLWDSDIAAGDPAHEADVFVAFGGLADGT